MGNEAIADTCVGTDLKPECETYESIALFCKLIAHLNHIKSDARSILNHFEGKWYKENETKETRAVPNKEVCCNRRGFKSSRILRIAVVTVPGFRLSAHSRTRNS